MPGSLSETATDEKVSDKVRDRSDDLRGSRLIGRILPPAVRFWLKSQVESVEQLEIDLEGRDRQLIGGYVPGVNVLANAVAYQGLHLDRVSLAAEDIRINIGQVVRGKALRLLKAFAVLGKITMSHASLSKSGSSPLLQSGLESLWMLLVNEPAIAAYVSQQINAVLAPPYQLAGGDVRLGESAIGLKFVPVTNAPAAEVSVILGTDVELRAGRYIVLRSPRWLTHLSELDAPQNGTPASALDGFEIDLGQDTQLSELVITPGELCCTGQVIVQP